MSRSQRIERNQCLTFKGLYWKDVGAHGHVQYVSQWEMSLYALVTRLDIYIKSSCPDANHGATSPRHPPPPPHTGGRVSIKHECGQTPATTFKISLTGMKRKVDGNGQNESDDTLRAGTRRSTRLHCDDRRTSATEETPTVFPLV